MWKVRKSTIIILLIFLWLFIGHSTQAAPVFVYIECSDKNTYTPNTTFQANLNILLGFLSSNTTRNNGYFHTAVGQDSPNVAYGLSLCQGDVNSNVCQECISAATTEIVNRCPTEKEAVIWYEKCMLRYADQSFITINNQSLAIYYSSDFSAPEEKHFTKLLNSTLNELITHASNSESADSHRYMIRGFATETVTYGTAKSLYALVQCTPDLSTNECSRCLVQAKSYLPRCCNNKQGGRVLLWSCNLRYEMYPFFNILDSAPSPSPTSSSLRKRKGKERIATEVVVTIVALICVSLVLSVIGYCLLIKRKVMRKDKDVDSEADFSGDATNSNLFNSETEVTSIESLRFDLSTIKEATDNFSDSNKIGEGGFGEVFKGVLNNGQEIAVKRLARFSRQGTKEFKNEVVLLAKLQHRNLVRLLKFCLEGEEKILVYEYIPNKSLDYHLFDPEKQMELVWATRYKTIAGIARGILYLHEESQPRIIHRDLKASNILLDTDMNPKVADFGLARIFGADQIQGKTSRIVGTYGYMSPEYAIQGHFSVRSDVYSFGVLVLEIISGKRNNSFYESNYAEDLLCYAWRLWRDGKALELMDPTLTETFSAKEVIRCIHIGLLCVQEDVDARPTMDSVVLMLNSNSATLPVPEQPAFFTHNKIRSMPSGLKSDYYGNSSQFWSVDDETITILHPR